MGDLCDCPSVSGRGLIQHLGADAMGERCRVVVTAGSRRPSVARPSAVEPADHRPPTMSEGETSIGRGVRLYPPEGEKVHEIRWTVALDSKCQSLYVRTFPPIALSQSKHATDKN
jgi:hypothetical protein